MIYDPRAAAAFYDTYGEREWSRFEAPGWQASFATHTHYLRRHVQAGDRVLDIGCGPGRFTLELVALGAHVVAADLSPRQLELHALNVPDEAIEARVVADVLDLSQFADNSFDATVCYGGPLSYVLDEAPRAVAELVRVTRPGGLVLVSTMALIGATLSANGGIFRLVQEFGEETVREVTQTGRLPSALSNGHLDMQLYRSNELRALLEPHGTVVAASATGIFTGSDADPALLAALELDLGAEPGALDLGNHILVVLEVAP